MGLFCFFPDTMVVCAEKRKSFFYDLLRHMKITRLRLAMILAVLGAIPPCTRLSLALAPTETDQRIITLSNRIEKRATKEELDYAQKQLNYLTVRVDKIGEKTSNTATEMRIVEVIGGGWHS
jgi:hypothetical protein